MAIIKTQGIVLKHTNLGEADRILTILTKHKGKIKAVAKNCRKPKSNLLACGEVFTLGEFVLYKGANLYQITSGETIETNYNIRKDLLRLSHGVYFAELVDAVSDEDINSELLFMLFARTLYHLAAGKIPVGILNIAFQLKIMDLSGYKPNLNRCVSCRKTADSYEAFSIDYGGVVCANCAKADIQVVKISKGTLDTIKFLLETKISGLNNIKMDNTIYNEINNIMRKFVGRHLDRSFKSMSFLDSIRDK